MEIKTKFNIGDKVVTVKDCRPIEFTVGVIVIANNGVAYAPDIWEACIQPIKEECCFNSKEELIEHISNEQTA